MNNNSINVSTCADQPNVTCFKKLNLNWEVKASQPVSYKVSINRGLLNLTNADFANACGTDGSKATQRLVVIDKVVYDLYKKQFESYFKAWKIKPVWKVMTAGESSKTMEQALAVADAMNKAGLLRRTEAVIAVGGGVLLDIVGFAASLYRRGIPYIRVPTTLMGQIDAGIGIKTGINHGTHKNRLGTYFAPTAALIDPMFLQTVDERHIVNGVAEIIKMALIKDSTLFELLEQEVDNLNAKTFSSNDRTIEAIISRAIAGMLEELQPNLWEADLERIVDYGHTFSPSLELVAADPTLLHGEAVAIDMALSIALAMNRKLITHAQAERVLKLMSDIGLSIYHPDFNTELVVKGLEDSTKHRDGLQRVPLTKGIGDAVFVNDLNRRELREALQFVQQYARNFYLQKKIA